MRKIVFMLLIILSSLRSNAQTYTTISYSELSVISLSVSISYSGSSYSSPYLNTSSALNTLQAKYDYYYNMINYEWGRLEDFKLINTSNIKTLNNHKIDVRNWFATHNTANIDWARSGNYAIEIMKYVGGIYNVSTIKNEINLLKAINTEYYRLKDANPDSFHKSDRYAELITVLGKLKTCSASSIGSLSTTYGLW